MLWEKSRAETDGEHLIEAFRRRERRGSLLPKSRPARIQQSSTRLIDKPFAYNSLKVQEFAATCEAVAATTRKTEKVRRVAEYFRSRPAEAGQAAIFLSGRVFPAWEERTLQVGGTLLWRAVGEISGKGEVALTAAYRRHGDLGAAAAEVLADHAPRESTLSIPALAATFERLASTSNTAQKLATIKDLLRQSTALEAKYIVKIITGDMRIGLRESLVEEAIAAAFQSPLPAVQRANMLLGDIRETLELAAQGRLAEARMRLFHPIGFMLASPAEDATEAFEYFTQALVEDKYDGIRAQAHCGGKSDAQVRIFSRTLDEISGSFPELPPALLAFPEPVILDGEILAWESEMRNGTLVGRARPFSELQKRLGRKKVTAEMVRLLPTAYVVFDVLYAGGELLLERPLQERKKILAQIFASVPEGGLTTERLIAAETAQGDIMFEPAVSASGSAPRVVQAPFLTASSPEHLEQLFSEARDRGNEGLLVKDVNSLYTPGRRGKSWLKMKRELATLDVVVTAVEWGHGKRIKVLSDYTFAIRSGDELLNVGKAYSGLSDAEIAEMTDWFLKHTLEDQGFRRIVEPKIVLEVAFNNVMRSDRHASGFALRFPRILRIRNDKNADEIDTLETVRKIYETQHLKEEQDDGN